MRGSTRVRAPAILALAIIVSLPPVAVAETPQSPSDEFQGAPAAKPAQVVLAALGLPEAGEISLRLGSYGTIEVLYGEDVQLSLPKLGCAGTEDIVTCFLDAHGSIFGWDGWEPLGGALVALPPVLSGEFAEHRLQLFVGGVPLENAWINLRIWDNSVVVAAKSTLFPALGATNSVVAALVLASEKASESQFIDDSILDHLSADVSASSSPAAFEVKSVRASLRAIHGGGQAGAKAARVRRA